MNGTFYVVEEWKSCSSSQENSEEKDDSFEVLSFGDESDAESESFIEVTVEDINCLENKSTDVNNFSLFGLPSRLLSYFNPLVEEPPSVTTYLIEEIREEEEEEKKREIIDNETNNNEVSFSEEKTFGDGEAEDEDDGSEISDVEDIPEFDYEEMYFRARPHALHDRKRFNHRFGYKFKSNRNTIRVI